MSEYTDKFDEIYDINYWASDESHSGGGSTLDSTTNIRKWIPKIVKSLDIKSILDLPCGDLNWMQAIIPEMNVEYTGVDVSSRVIAHNREKYSMLQFLELNAYEDEIPQADLIISRDFLQHVPTAHAEKILEKFKASGARYLLTTTRTLADNLPDITVGDYHPFNANIFLGKPELLIQEPEEHQYLALWRIND